jgi:hypothetical protein
VPDGEALVCGAPVEINAIPDISNLKTTFRAPNMLFIAWKWPADITSAAVCVGHGSPPTPPEGRYADDVQRCSKTQQTRGLGVSFQVSPGETVYIAVYAARNEGAPDGTSRWRYSRPGVRRAISIPSSTGGIASLARIIPRRMTQRVANRGTCQ